MHPSRNTVIALILGLIVLGAAGYVLFLRKPAETLQPLPGNPLGSAEITFITLAAQLDPIALDPAVLSDPRFRSLVDIHTTVVPEAGGRNDPFAALSGGAAQ